jgi:hypothetical protein
MRDEYKILMQRADVEDSLAKQLAKWQTTKWALFSAMASDSAAVIEINGVCVLLKSIEREDSSGQKFNLTVHHNGRDYKCFARTD